MLLEISDKKGLRIIPTENIMLATENLENKNIILLLINGYEVKLKYESTEELKRDFRNIKANWYKDHLFLENKDFYIE